MKISTRGRYALRAFVDLAEQNRGEYIPLKEIAERQEVSLKYLGPIMLQAAKSGLLEAQHGKGGGYRLARSPEAITAGEVLRVAEGDLAPVECLVCGAKPCPRAARCPTLRLWEGFYSLTQEYFDGVTLAALAQRTDVGDYVI